MHRHIHYFIRRCITPTRHLLHTRPRTFLTLGALTLFSFSTLIANAEPISDKSSTSFPKSSQAVPKEDKFDNFIPPNRSGPIPKIQDDYIYKLVGNTLESVVFNPNSNVLLKLFASDCHNCRNLGIVYKIIAEEYNKTLKDFNNTTIPNIIFAEMDGQENYIRGLVDFANEGRFPHVIAFPSGNEKRETFAKASAMTEQIAKYYNPLLREELSKVVSARSDNSKTKTIVEKSENQKLPEQSQPEFARKDIPVTGKPWVMRWGPGRTVVDAMVDFLEKEFILRDKQQGSKDYTTSSNFLTVFKSRLQARIPEIKNLVLEAARDEYLEPHDYVTINDPCGKYLEEAYKGFYTATMGLSDPVDSSLYMSDYRQCVWSKPEQVKDYYLHIKQHIDFIEDCYRNKTDWEDQDKQIREFYKQS